MATANTDISSLLQQAKENFNSLKTGGKVSIVFPNVEIKPIYNN